MTPQIFNFNSSPVRVIDRNGEPWFVAADVCRVLDIGNPTEALRGLDEDEKNTLRITEGIQTAGNPNVNVINEPGLYTLIIRSRKPEANLFRRWVTHEVLPAIRKTGQYAVAPAAPVLPKTYAEALRALAAEVEAKEALALEAQKNAPLVEFYHTVANSEDAIGWNEAAKLLKLGRNKMLRELRRKQIINGKNIPYQRYLDARLFRVIESSYPDSEGDAHITLTTKVFQRGVEFLRRTFKLPNPEPQQITQ